MTRKVIVFFVLFGIFFSFVIFKQKVFALDCSNSAQIVTQADKNYCQDELEKIEDELAALLKKQEKQKKQTGTLKGDVDYLNSQINALKTKISARAMAIAQLKNSIKEKVSTITTLSQQIKREHESLAQLLRNTNEFDNENILHLVLSDKTISEYYADLESYASIKQAIKDSVDRINGIKTETEIEKQDLEVKQNKETDAKYELESAQKKVAVSEAEKKKLLAISKQKEAEYQKLAAEKKAKADQIRSALFPLRDAKAISFGTALEYANYVKTKIGIDPAFLLAILKQESNLGANVGQCLVTNLETGDGIGKNTGTFFEKVMGSGSLAYFPKITSAAGLDWRTTPVSCPIDIKRVGTATKYYQGRGYGGAMGPAQFIPSTWILFETRLKDILGYSPNPWNPKDAFLASAMYLNDLGAIGNVPSSQHKAACRYYGSGGNTCAYSNSVMSLKIKIQADIDLLNNE